MQYSKNPKIINQYFGGTFDAWRLVLLFYMYDTKQISIPDIIKRVRVFTCFPWDQKNSATRAGSFFISTEIPFLKYRAYGCGGFSYRPPGVNLSVVKKRQKRYRIAKKVYYEKTTPMGFVVTKCYAPKFSKEILWLKKHKLM